MRPSFWRSVSAAYSDAYAALRAMPLIALAAFAISFGSLAFEQIFLPQELPPGNFLRLIVTSLSSLLWAPVMVAIHRFIILNEVTRSYRFELRDLRFFQWSFLINALFHLVGEFSRLFASISSISYLFTLPVLILAFIISIRLILLFPAIAVEAPGASWRNAYRDSRGNLIWIVETIIVTMVPLLAVFLLVVWLGDLTTRGTTSGTTIAAGAISAALNVVFVATLVAIASRFYEWMGDRLKREG